MDCGIGKVDTDLLGLDEAPQWVENAWFQVVKTVMPGKRLPTAGEMDLEALGEIFAGFKSSQKCSRAKLKSHQR